MTNHHAVVIVGGGPTGLMLAAELALARVDVALVERRPTQELAGSRAGGLHARTLEVLDQRGVVERFLAAGQKMQVLSFAGQPLDLADCPTRHAYGLALWQNHIERLLADWVGELPVTRYRGAEVTAIAQTPDAVAVALADGRTLHAAYAVGCDGGRSLVRKQAGIAFAGLDASTSYLIAEVTLRDEPPWGFRGPHALGKLDGDARRTRVVIEDEGVVDDPEPTLADLRAALVRVYGTDFGAHAPTWLSRFGDATRQAAAYRAGRILVAGDAAHVHSPVGGQGLNLGVQDAVNLGWKLARVVRGAAPESLLDTYHAERHPVGARVLRTPLAGTALRRTDERSQALAEHVAALVRFAEPRRHYAAMLAGLDIHYDLGEATHPLVGRRVPDLDLVLDGAPTRMFALLHAAEPVVLDFTTTALCTAAWDLPALGVVPAPTALLVRPDGYVAWARADGTHAGLAEARARWAC